MIRVLLCLAGVGVYASAGPAPAGRVQLENTAVLQSARGDEPHSVIVDMPQVVSLDFASPDSWDRLPIEAQPDWQQNAARSVDSSRRS
jgi:hypothetical protein